RTPRTAWKLRDLKTSFAPFHCDTRSRVGRCLRTLMTHCSTPRPTILRLALRSSPVQLQNARNSLALDSSAHANARDAMDSTGLEDISCAISLSSVTR